MHAWVPGVCIVVWAWISLRSHEASTHEYFSLHIIVKLSGSESKVHVFQAIFFQTILHASVTSHLARFPKDLLLVPRVLPWDMVDNSSSLRKSCFG
jgi:hypothetical protein